MDIISALSKMAEVSDGKFEEKTKASPETTGKFDKLLEDDKLNDLSKSDQPQTILSKEEIDYKFSSMFDDGEDNIDPNVKDVMEETKNEELSSLDYDTDEEENRHQPGDLRDEYKKLIENGEYESVEEMCNDLGLDYYDVYYTEDEFDDEEDDYDDQEKVDDDNSESEKTYPCQEEIDGKVYYYDDNGTLYRIDNDLIPNSQYEINGYKYTTDDMGRIISAEGTLKMKNRDGRLPIRDSIEDIGKGDQKEGDDRGHLIGDQFDGTNGLENMIPQDADINRNDFKNFENELANEVKAGKTVEVKVEPIYDGDSRRPDAIVVTYKIDGVESVRIFPNNKEE